MELRLPSQKAGFKRAPARGRSWRAESARGLARSTTLARSPCTLELPPGFWTAVVLYRFDARVPKTSAGEMLPRCPQLKRERTRALQNLAEVQRSRIARNVLR